MTGLAVAAGLLLAAILVYVWERKARQTPLRRETERVLLMDGPQGASRVRRYRLLQLAMPAVLAAGAVAAAVLAFLEPPAPEVQWLTRPAYGQGSHTVALDVRDGEASYRVDAKVREQLPGAEEQAEWLAEVYDRLLPVLLGRNAAFDELKSNLTVPELFENARVRLQSQAPDLVSSFGEVYREAADPEGSEAILVITLTYGEAELNRGLRVKVIGFSPEEIPFAERWEEAFAAAESDRAGEDVDLPEDVGGRELVYTYPRDPAFLRAAGAAVLLALALAAAARHIRSDREEKRLAALEAGYSRIISRLTIYVRAGLSLPAAWARVAGREEDAVPGDDAGAEMRVTARQLEAGASFAGAMEEFAGRVRHPAYRRLAALLAGAEQHGGEDILRRMEHEAFQAGEEERSRSVRRGKETETRLMLPLGLMLFVVLMVLIVPLFGGL